MPYQIGRIEFLKNDDPTYIDYFEALGKAQDNSIDDSFWGVWTSQSEGGELLAIVYQGETFQK